MSIPLLPSSSPLRTAALFQLPAFLTTVSSSGSASELLYDWRFTANQFLLATSPLRLTTSNFILHLDTCGYSPYVTSSLTRGWVCRLHLLLVSASAVILRFEFRGTHDQILLSQIQDPQPGGPGPRIYIPQEQGGPITHPNTGFHFVASYDSQGYGGGIRPRLHSGFN
jgi:hypothetical protein